MILLLSACADKEPTTTDSGATSAETGTVPTQAAPIAEALSERCKDPTPSRVVPSGVWMHRVTLEDAGARCNDGTPPVLYVRRNSDPTHEQDWVIHLMGGGACSNYEECASRWCGEGASDAGDMSSQWAPETGGQTGILSPDPANNAFAGWNVAQIYYCSSDLWVGTADLAFESKVTGERPYEIGFHGADILDAALEALNGGLSSDDGLITMLPMTGASTVLFTGSGSGGYGAVVHLSRIAEAYPAARVIGVADSVFSPNPDVITAKQAAGLDVAIAARYTDQIDGVYQGYVDTNCLGTGESAAQCSDVGTLVREHLTTELVFRHDLFDGLAADLAAASGVRAEDLAAAGEATLRAYGAAGIPVIGTTCGSHDILDAGAFAGEKVADALTGPPAVSLNDALAEAVAGTQRIAVDAAAGTGSICP